MKSIVLEKRVNVNGREMIVVFYKENGDNKCRFEIKGNPVLTDKLLSSVKNKRAQTENLHFAIKGIREKLAELTDRGAVEANEPNGADDRNPVVVLNELCQKKHGKSIETAIVEKSGEDHCPTIWVEITLPSGRTFSAKGRNQREARANAARMALGIINNQ